MAAIYGIGNHQSLLNKSNIVQANKWSWIGRIMAVFAAVVGKMVVIALLLRIQGTTHRRKAWILHFIWMSNVGLSIALVVVLSLRCRPTALWWDKSLKGSCNAIDPKISEVMGIFQGSWLAASDIALATYPIFVFWNLQMSWKRKAGLCALMGGGVIAGACGAIKTVQVQLAYESEDVTYNIYPLLVTSLVEAWMILILASIPPLRPLFAKAFEKTRATLSHGSVAYDRTAKSQRHVDSHGTIQLNELPRGSKSWPDARKWAHRHVAEIEDDSEEEILPWQSAKVEVETLSSADGIPQPATQQGITITRHYDVRYESNDAVMT